MATLRELTSRFTRAGRLDAIIVRPARGIPAEFIQHARAEPGRGLLNDRYSARPKKPENSGRRELTLIQAEHLPLLAQWTNQEMLDARLLRRNLVVSELNLLSMRSPFPDQPLIWQIGEQLQIEITGPCDPCSKMETELGHGSYNIMRGHGGVTARVVQAGEINVGDEIRLVNLTDKYAE